MRDCSPTRQEVSDAAALEGCLVALETHAASLTTLGRWRGHSEYSPGTADQKFGRSQTTELIDSEVFLKQRLMATIWP